MEKEKDEEYNSMVNTNTMLLSFEGWIKYIEGFSRGLQTTKTVDSGMVFDCVGEIMEYMKQLKGQICTLLLHCEEILEQEETSNNKMEKLQKQITQLTQQNQNLTSTIDELNQQKANVEQENNKLKQALTLIQEKHNGKL